MTSSLRSSASAEPDGFSIRLNLRPRKRALDRERAGLHAEKLEIVAFSARRSVMSQSAQPSPSRRRAPSPRVETRRSLSMAFADPEGLAGRRVRPDAVIVTPPLKLLSRLPSESIPVTDRAHVAYWIRVFATENGSWANIPSRSNRREPICFGPQLHRARNLVERFFNKIKQCWRIATCYNKLAATYLGLIQLASIRL
jgi:hypothetical protein